MAPKKTVFTLKPSDAPSGTPQWRYRNDAKLPESNPDAWTPYSTEDSNLIEAAHLKGLKMATLGVYIVDTKQKKQIHATNPLKQRNVKRFLVQADGSVTAQTKTTTSSATVVGSSAGAAADGSVDVRASLVPSPTKPLLFSKVGSSASISGKPTSPTMSPKIHVVADESRKTSRPSTNGTTTTALDLDTAPPPPKKARSDPSTATAVAPASYSSSPMTAGMFSIKDYPRPQANLQPVLFTNGTDKPMDEVARGAIHNLLVKVRSINRTKLDAASVLIEPTRRWLKSLGRPEKQSGVFINLAQPLTTLPAARRVAFTEKHTSTCAQAVELAKSAIVTYVGSRPPRLLLPNTSQAKMNSMSNEEHLKTQQVMISGPVKILYDGYYQALPNPPTVVVCSTPGINFSYSDADRKCFTMVNPEDDGAGRVLNKERTLQRMRVIWQHIILVMEQKFKVNFPILCGIGCGAFKGSYGARVPLLWGTALAQVICNSSKVLKNVKAIFVSLPTFGMDNNFGPFASAMQSVFDAEKAKGVVAPYPPVVLVEDASMIDMAKELAETPLEDGKAAVVGVLNPSDVQALRHGWIGMYWDGGHIALEEMVAMQTTLLLHHVGLNPDLFQDSSRLVGMSKIISDE